MNEIARKELQDLVAKSEGTSMRIVIRAVEGKVSEDNIEQIQEQYNLVEDNSVVRSIDFVGSRTCDFGHVQGQGKKAQIIGRCGVCGKYTCSFSAEGENNKCNHVCSRCGISLCRVDASVYGSEAYCPSCKIYKYGSMTWELIKKVVK